jgi:hypothetical protein
MNFLNMQMVEDTNDITSTSDRPEEARAAAELMGSTACVPKENGNALSSIKRYDLKTEV